MPSPLRQPYFTGGEFVARKPFTWSGEDYVTGDNFPHEELGVPEKKLRTMYNAGFLRRPDPEADEESDDDGKTEMTAEEKAKVRAEAKAKSRAEAKKLRKANKNKLKVE